MKLYDLHRGEMFKLKAQPVLPPSSPQEVNLLKTYILRNIDGMFTFCLDEQGNVYHFAAYSEVDPIAYS